MENEKNGFTKLDHFPNNTPPVVSAELGELRALNFTEFSVLHSSEMKSAAYSVQKMNQNTLQAAKKVPREGRFYEEARLPSSERAKLSDYQNSGFDRGHLSPAATMSTPEGMAQSFSLANVAPQAPELNRALWKKVEHAVKHQAARSQDDVFVFTGPMYLDEEPQYAGGVRVPSHFFKAVVCPSTGYGAGWVMTNDGNNRMEAPIPLEEISNIAGIDFLP